MTNTIPAPTAENKAAAEVLRAKALAQRQAKEESFDRSDTDGFLSQWAHGLCAQRDDLQAIVVENGGRSSFPALFDLQGRLVAAKLIHIQSKFHRGTDTMWGILAKDDPTSAVVKWVKAFPARTSTLEKKGYREGQVFAKAKADLVGEKNVSAAIVRADGGFSRDVLVLDDGAPVAVEVAA